MTQCEKCGKRLNEDAKFCKHCGASLVVGIVSAPIALDNPIEENTSNRKPTRSRLIFSIAIIAVLVIIAAFILGQYHGKKEQPFPQQISDYEVTPSTTTSTEPAIDVFEVPTDSYETNTENDSAMTSVLTSGAPIKASYAIASSERRSMTDSTTGKTVTYGAANAIDGNNSTAWVEGANGDGIGEWIQVNLSQSTMLTGLRIKNGYWKSENHLQKNTRIAKILVSFSDESSETFELYDPREKLPGILSSNGQDVVFTQPHMSDYVKVTILAVYRDGAEDYDTCISELVPLV